MNKYLFFFALKNTGTYFLSLAVETLSPASTRLSQVIEESVNVEPILLIVSPGADPSEELRTLSKTSLGVNLHEVKICFFSLQAFFLYC